MRTERLGVSRKSLVLVVLFIATIPSGQLASAEPTVAEVNLHCSTSGIFFYESHTVSNSPPHTISCLVENPTDQREKIRFGWSPGPISDIDTSDIHLEPQSNHTLVFDLVEHGIRQHITGEVFRNFTITATVVGIGEDDSSPQNYADAEFNYAFYRNPTEFFNLNPYDSETQILTTSTVDNVIATESTITTENLFWKRFFSEDQSEFQFNWTHFTDCDDFIRLYGIQCIAGSKGLESLILLEQPTNSSAWEELTNGTFRLIIDTSFTVETNEYGLQSMYCENCSTTVDVILEIYFIPTAESNAMDYNLPILFGVLVVVILIGTRMRSK